MTTAPKSPSKRGGRKPGQANKVTHASISREIKIAALAALNFVGKEKYLIKVAKTHPAAFLQFLGKFVQREEDVPTEIRVVVQTLAPSNSPIPGVIRSPIAGHVSPVHLIANGGEVIDAEVVREASHG
jgi:hypothetical protein